MVFITKKLNKQSKGVSLALNFSVAKRVKDRLWAKFKLKTNLLKRREAITVSQRLQAKISAGFTLVEMLVSLALFTIVVTMAVGTLLILINANGIAQGMQLVMTNLSFTMDSMTREVRTATDWYCGRYTGNENSFPVPTDDGSLDSATQDCVAGDNANYLSIVESGNSLTAGYSNRRITYWYRKDLHATGHGGISRKLGDDGPWVDLTGPDVAIDTMKFVVSDTERYVHGLSNERQPSATVFLKGRAGFDSGNPNDRGVRVKEFKLQTSITQRLLDI